MRRDVAISVFLSFLALFILIGQATAADEPAASPDPVIHFPQAEFQFEPVVDGAEVVHTFPVENRGAAQLLIDKVLTG